MLRFSLVWCVVTMEQVTSKYLSTYMSDITIYYLEMLSPEVHQQKMLPADLSVNEAQVKQYQVNRMLYQLVGESFQWNEKTDWTAGKWRDYAESESVRTWIAYHQGSIAGYFELQQIDSQTNELAYFGLAGKFIGRGFGGALLSTAVTQAWSWAKPQRIIVNTCSLDHPNALANYKARGFSVCETKTVPA